jgi:hypothetical protein
MMPIKVYATPPGGNIVMRSNPVSAIDMFASAANYNKLNRYGFLHLRRRPGVNQANALLTVYTPFNKADSVIEGSADAWFAKSEEVPKGVVPEWERKVAQSTAIIGGPAAAIAAYQAAKAVKAGKTGGLPRDAARLAGARYGKKSKIARAAAKGAEYLDKPMSTRAKVASGVAGAGLIGLHAYTAAGDAAVIHSMHKLKQQEARKGDKGAHD